MRMTWFHHLKIANKIMPSVASMAALMVLLAAFGVAQMGALDAMLEQYRALAPDGAERATLEEFEQSLVRYRGAVRQVMALSRSSDQAAARALLRGESRRHNFASADLVHRLVDIDQAGSAAAARAEVAGNAGAAIREVAAGAGQVAAIMAEISAASREQSVGVDQLSRSLVAIDESTRHDAELAGHSLASTAELERQAVGLGRLVAAFRLPNGAAPALEQGRPGLRRVPPLPLPA